MACLRKAVDFAEQPTLGSEAQRHRGPRVHLGARAKGWEGALRGLAGAVS